MFYFTNLTLFIYILTIIYFVMLGCFMLTLRSNPLSTRGEIVAKKRMTRSVGFFMFYWAFDYLIYLLPFTDNAVSFQGTGNDVCFLITMMLVTPLLFIVMHAVVQKQVDTTKWTIATSLPFLILTLCYPLKSKGFSSSLCVDLALIINVLYICFLLIRYAKEYRLYVQRIKSEYSDISGREIFWAWSCFGGFAVQDFIFLIYVRNWVPNLEYFYWLMSIANAAYFCYCAYRQKPLDIDVVEELDEKEAMTDVVPKEDSDEKAFFAVIDQKLENLCEDKLLFLDPDLTREVLCRRLSISGTYLKMYFRSRNLSFYQYINTLRVEYAYKLMQENPEMSIHDVSEQSGFRSQTTFRKTFLDVIGCLPSELRSKRKR